MNWIRDVMMVKDDKTDSSRGGAPTGVPLARGKVADRRKTRRSAKKLPVGEKAAN
jgi:hypothetical protein